MEKFKASLIDNQTGTLPFTQLPKELNQHIFSFFSNPVDLVKASTVNKTFKIFNKNTLTSIKEKLNHTINILSDTTKARKLPIDEIEEHINFLFRVGYKFAAFKALQDIFHNEGGRLQHPSYHSGEEAGNIEQYRNLKNLLVNKFKLAGHIDAYFFTTIENGTIKTCPDDQKYILFVTLYAIKILLNDYYEIPAVQEDFGLVNKYFEKKYLFEEIFYKKDNKAYLGNDLLDDLLGEFDDYEQKPAAIEAAKQWLKENGYNLNVDAVESQTPKLNM